MSFLARLLDFLAAQYRWGLHHFKISIALALPVVIAYLADRRVRRLAAVVTAEEERVRRLPRIRRR